MKTRNLTLAGVVVLVGLGTWWLAEPGVVNAAGGWEAGVGRSMRTMGRAYRALGERVDDVAEGRQRELAIDAVARLHVAAIHAQRATPRRFEDLPVNEQVDAVAAYRAGMTELVDAIVLCESHIRQGDAVAARAAYRTVGELKDHWHQRYSGER